MLRKRDGQIGPVSPFSPRSSPLTSKIFYSGVRQSKITKGLALQHRFNRIIAFWKSSTYAARSVFKVKVIQMHVFFTQSLDHPDTHVL